MCTFDKPRWSLITRLICFCLTIVKVSEKSTCGTTKSNHYAFWLQYQSFVGTSRFYAPGVLNHAHRDCWSERYKKDSSEQRHAGALNQPLGLYFGIPQKEEYCNHVTKDLRMFSTVYVPLSWVLNKQKEEITFDWTSIPETRRNEAEVNVQNARERRATLELWVGNGWLKGVHPPLRCILNYIEYLDICISEWLILHLFVHQQSSSWWFWALLQLQGIWLYITPLNST